MNERLAEQAIQSCVDVCPQFIEPTEVSGIVKVKPFVVDESFLIYACMGWEADVMEEPSYFSKGWKPQMFGVAVNTLVAEYFGEGSVVDLNEWVYRSQCCTNAVSVEAYHNHSFIDPDVLRKYIRTDL